jgi:anti-anti-sigma regulatory factor
VIARASHAVHLTDTDGADILIQMAEKLRSRGATLELAQVHPPVLAIWRRAGLIEVIGDHAVFDTLLEAVERGPGQPASATRPVA